jgi:hypothetical protein
LICINRTTAVQDERCILIRDAVVLRASLPGPLAPAPPELRPMLAMPHQMSARTQGACHVAIGSRPRKRFWPGEPRVPRAVIAASLPLVDRRDLGLPARAGAACVGAPGTRIRESAPERLRHCSGALRRIKVLHRAPA